MHARGWSTKKRKIKKSTHNASINHIRAHGMALFSTDDDPSMSEYLLELLARCILHT